MEASGASAASGVGGLSGGGGFFEDDAASSEVGGRSEGMAEGVAHDGNGETNRTAARCGGIGVRNIANSIDCGLSVRLKCLRERLTLKKRPSAARKAAKKASFILDSYYTPLNERIMKCDCAA